MKLPGVLLIAHGSRLTSANDEIRALTAKMALRLDAIADIDCAFLEMTEPSIPTALRGMIASGARRIVVLPYFLSGGRHVLTDIPQAVAAIQQEYADVTITIGGYLGANPQVEHLLAQQALLELTPLSQGSNHPI
jgi:sirohydrochlorin ferrochelatase